PEGHVRGLRRHSRAKAAGQEEVATGRFRRRCPPDRRLGARLCRPRGRQRQEAERVAPEVPGGRQRECFHRWLPPMAARRANATERPGPDPTKDKPNHPERSERMATSKIPITQREAWKALQAHHRDVRGQHLRQWFADDPSRGERLTAEAAGIYLDYS